MKNHKKDTSTIKMLVSGQISARFYPLAPLAPEAWVVMALEIISDW